MMGQSLVDLLSILLPRADSAFTETEARYAALCDRVREARPEDMPEVVALLLERFDDLVEYQLRRHLGIYILRYQGIPGTTEVRVTYKGKEILRDYHT